MLALTEGQVQVGFVSGHSLRPELNCIFSVQVCLGQVNYVAVQLALNSFLVSDHEQCSSWCCCLQVVCQETEFLCKSCLAFAVNHCCCFCSSRCHRITISFAACNRGACSGMSSTCANTGSNKQAAEGTGSKLSLFTSMIGRKRLWSSFSNIAAAVLVDGYFYGIWYAITGLGQYSSIILLLYCPNHTSIFGCGHCNWHSA